MLTQKQRAVFNYLVSFQERNGRTPTGPEIAAHFGYTDPSSAYQHLRLIEKKGYLRIIRQGRKTPLRITLTQLGAQLVRRYWPMFGAIPAGPLDMTQGEEEAQIAKVEDLLPMIRSDDYFLRVNGDSMVNAGLEDGMTVLVRPGAPVRQGEICAVWIEGEGGTLKRVYRQQDRVRLVPENDRYEAAEYPSDHVRIQGLVVAALSVRTLHTPPHAAATHS